MFTQTFLSETGFFLKPRVHGGKNAITTHKFGVIVRNHAKS